MQHFYIHDIDSKKTPTLKNEDFSWIWDLEEVKKIDLEEIDAIEKYRKQNNLAGEIINNLSKENIVNYVKNNLNIENINCISRLIVTLNTNENCVDSKKGFIFNKNDCGDFSYALSGTYDHHKYSEIDFFKNLIEKYKLDSFQVAVLLINVDLLYSMFYEYRGKEIYDMDYSFFNNSITDKIIKNIKLLTSDELFHSITTNQFASLQNSPILFQDNYKILKEYPNITNSDLIQLAFLDKKLIIEYIKLLNECDEEGKNLILDFIQPLKSNNYLFPSVIDDIKIIDNKPISQFQEIFKKNPRIFNKYNYFFQKNFDHEFLKQIINNKDILKILLSLKNAFLNNIPDMIDSRHSYSTYEFVTEDVKTYNEEWETQTIIEPKTIHGGILDYKEETAKKYIEIIFKIKDAIINSNSKFDISKLIESYINLETRNFFTSFLGEYYLNENKEKVKRHVIEMHPLE